MQHYLLREKNFLMFVDFKNKKCIIICIIYKIKYKYKYKLQQPR